MPEAYDVAAIGNAIVDVISPADDAFIGAEGLVKGAMGLIDEARALSLYAAMGKGVETSGGSAANTAVGVASLGGRSAFIGKVAADALGAVFVADIRAAGVAFSTSALEQAEATATSLINVTPDGQRTMSTFLGASTRLTPKDVDEALIKASAIVYMEGYLFDAPEARAAFVRASSLAHDAGRRVAVTLSDAFVVERHRAGLLAFLEAEADVILANEAEALSLFQTTDLRAAAAALGELAPLAAITRGAEGSLVLEAGRSVAGAALPVERVLDTTGAGDQYAAGFLFGVARALPLAECARLGHLAAAEVVGHYGPRPETSLKRLAFGADAREPLE